MTPIIIGVSGVNASDNPSPGVGVAKSLKEANPGAVIVGLAYDAMEPGVYMDWLIDRSYLIPYPAANAVDFLDRLIYIKNTFGLDVIIPTLDSELPFFIQYQDALLKHQIKTWVPTEEQYRSRQKTRLTEISNICQVLCPPQKEVTNANEVYQAVDVLGLPVMVKGALYKAYSAYTIDDVLSGFSKIVAEWGYPVIIQKQVQGDEVNVIGVGDGQGHLLGMVAVKKLITTTIGKIWTGVTINHQKLRDTALQFVKKTKWRGAFELECIVGEQELYLIEINPRFPAWVYFATGVGVNLPLMVQKLALGEKVKAVDSYETGKLYIRYVGEQVCDMSKFQSMITHGEG